MNKSKRLKKQIKKGKSLQSKIYKLNKNLIVNQINIFSRKYSKYSINKTMKRVKNMQKFQKKISKNKKINKQIINN